MESKSACDLLAPSQRKRNVVSKNKTKPKTKTKQTKKAKEKNLKELT